VKLLTLRSTVISLAIVVIYLLIVGLLYRQLAAPGP